AHDLESAAAPTPVWPYLLALTALLFVLDVGVRRLRFGGGILRTLLDRTARRITGRAPSAASAIEARSTGLMSQVPRVRRLDMPHQGISHAPAATAPSQRLLAAKRRAAHHAAATPRRQP
ncbi:MAG: hypothetical protein JO023_28305, partial [Chloroflexi bacterium]|nr:hypothetical protein [Chloroflexota bacterium]